MPINNINHKEEHKNNIILKEVNIKGNLCGEFAEYTIDHVYENKGSNDVEAIYTFPVPEGAVISGFEAVLGGRTIKGLIQDKDEANKIYENFKNNDNNTFLLEEFRDNIIRIVIGKIISNEVVQIKVSYIEELSYENRNLKLIIPTIITPINLSREKELLTCKNGIINEDDDYKFTLSLLVESLTKLEFKCSSHKLKVEYEENNLYKVTLDGQNQRMDKDLEIILEEQEKVETTGMIYEYPREDKGILYLRFIPEIEIDQITSRENYIFLLDISESMGGDKLTEGKNALQLCLRNLAVGDTFNIVAFGDKLHYFSKEIKVEFNEENLSAASKWIKELRTENDAAIFDAIKYALLDKDDKAENIIFLFTDDVVYDEKEILDFVEDNIKESRIFPFGINTSVNSYFINKLARISYGAAEVINPDERIEDIVLKQFNRIKNPIVTDIEIDWGKMKVETTFPRTIEYMYDKEPFSIFAKVNGEVGGVVVLKGKVGKNRIQRVIFLNDLELEENVNLIEKMWYKKRIESLQHRVKYERGELQEAMNNKIVEISKKVGIICKETAFILYEEMEDPIVGIRIREILPVKTTKRLESFYGDVADDSESTSFYYKDVSKQEDNHEKYENYNRNELLRLLASNQFASGAFGIKAKDTLENNIKYTIKTILAFMIGSGDIKIYKNQLNKSLEFLNKTLQNIDINLNDELNLNKQEYLNLLLVFKLYIKKDVAMPFHKESILKKIQEIEEKFQYQNVNVDEIQKEFIKGLKLEINGLNAGSNQYKDTLDFIINTTILKTI
ncbi:VIT and VWA domain-containing protein [Clostridium estertheticum]|uniref:VIT and vWA domain-containing protein n=1 Tax=Clostridium estertheticum TaxID=238834 RepID=UPI001CF31451|nr:VIT and VWA domain-containing protein [Clostridium estertheticum]MCB2306487.1 VIT and VWA domain-containing protein [Clostridium estertheticum]MCB2345075.1 VIT and VWA domain-containing protein [Clostridium estertheticum]MCB2350151.1 VIT and VWA domain-containing protein [Clostridium estertheticum]WAG44259.1 VIT and VWA domain-containing protein [Clostridium estertheticum]